MRILLLLSFLLISGVSHAASNATLFMDSPEDFDIHFENRLLAQVNGKPVTIYDVMKKMDVMFYRQYPEYATNKQARYQYYQVSWKHVLKDLIEKELMMADAEESKLEVTASEVRQELEKSFGPNIIANLDKIDMNLDEAKEILQSEILIRKLMVYKVTGKAYRSINPQDLKNAYADWAKDNATPELFVYRVLTIRDGKDSEKGKSLSTLMHQWLKSGKGDFEEVKNYFEKLGVIPSSTKITVSEPLKIAKEEMSPEVKKIIDELDVKSFSNPIAQKSRRDNSVSWKIYVLDEVEKASIASFKEMEPKLRNDLMDKAITKEGKEYIDYLRSHYNVHDAYVSQLSQDFEPFNLIQLKKN